VNTLRTEPQIIAEKIREQMNTSVSEDGILTQTDNVRIRLKDGKQAYASAIKIISELEPIAPIKENKVLHQACKDYLGKVATYDDMNDIPNDLFKTILNKYGTFEGKLSQLNEYGGNSPLQVLINLLVEDGSDTKEYIQIFMNEKLKEIGLHFQAHNEYRFCTFIVLTTKFKNIEKTNDESDTQKYEVVEKKVKKEVLNNYLNDDAEEEVPQRNVCSGLRGKKNQKSSAPQIEDEDCMDEYFDENVKSVKKSSKIVLKNGKKFKVSTIIKTYKDGSTETEKESERID
jgi:hypothetical protein